MVASTARRHRRVLARPAPPDDGFVALPRRQGRLAVELVALAAVVTGVLQVVETRRGAGIGFDAAGYVGTARSLLHGRGVTTPVHFIGHARFTLDPPGYSLLLATARAVRLDPIDWARWVGLGLAVLVAALVGLLVWRANGSAVAAGLAALAAACSVDVLALTTSAGSDALALVAVLGCCLALAWRPALTWRAVVVAAACMAIAIATRFAGVAALGAGVWAVAWSPAPLRVRVRRALLLVVVAAVTVLAVAKGRRHGIGVHLHIAVQSVTSLRHAWPISHLHNHLPVLGALLGLALAGLAALVVLAALLPEPLCPSALRRWTPSLRGPVARSLAALAVSHLALVFLVTLLLQPRIDLGVRVNVPVVVAVIVLLTLAITDVLRALDVRPRQLVAGALVAAVAGLSLAPAIAQAATAPDHPSHLGYATSAWAEQRAELDRLRDLPAGTTLASDSAALVYFRTGHEVLRLPSVVDPDVGTSDPDYDAERAATIDALENTSSLLIGVQPSSDFSVHAETFAAAAHLTVVRQAHHVTIWAGPNTDPALLARLQHDD